MNETDIQTIRGGILHVIYQTQGHWTRTPKTSGLYYHHELYGYIPVSKLSELIQEDWDKNYMAWEKYAWLCYENRYLTIEQMTSQMVDCGHFAKFLISLKETFKQKYHTEQHHTVAKVFIDAEGTEYHSI